MGQSAFKDAKTRLLVGKSVSVEFTLQMTGATKQRRVVCLRVTVEELIKPSLTYIRC